MLQEMEERRNLLMKCIEERMLQESGERVKCYMNMEEGGNVGEKWKKNGKDKSFFVTLP